MQSFGEGTHETKRELQLIGEYDVACKQKGYLAKMATLWVNWEMATWNCMMHVWNWLGVDKSVVVKPKWQHYELFELI